MSCASSSVAPVATTNFYPRLYCTACMSEQVEWVRACGRGTVLSFTVVYRPVTKAFAEEVPYVVALVTLEEGPQLMSNIVECDPEQVAIGPAGRERVLRTGPRTSRC